MMNKETIKKFLKPDRKKVLITLVFIAVSLLFVYTPSFPEPDELGRVAIVDFYTSGRGWPLPYLTINIGGGVAQGFSIFYLGLVIDIIFWYFISCLVIFIWSKFRSKE